LKFGNGVIVKKESSLQIEVDLTKRNYLHLVPGTPGSDLGAGLFTKLFLYRKYLMMNLEESTLLFLNRCSIFSVTLFCITP
jgi:hypothetical protein